MRNDIDTKLLEWQQKYENAKAAYASEIELFKRSQAQYDGKMQPERGLETITLFNVTKELVESTNDPSVPAPKVSPDLPGERNRRLAKIAEDMCRFEARRLKFAENNDEDERTTRVTGGNIALIEWNNMITTHDTVGAVNVRMINPTQFIPQEKLYRKEYMDYIFLDFDVTKDSIKKKFGKDVESESLDPERGTDMNSDLVTQHYVFFRNKKNTIGCYSWCGYTVLVDDEEYQARGEKVCASCGRTKPTGENKCTCGSKKWVKRNLYEEELFEDIILSDSETGESRVIPAMDFARNEDGSIALQDVEIPVIDQTGLPLYEMLFDEQQNVIGEVPVLRTEQQPYMVPTVIPYYTPKGFPVAVRKNVSASKRFLGDSDCEAIYEGQNTINKLCTGMVRKLMKAGTILTKPRHLNFNFTNGEQVLELESPDQMSMIQVRNMNFETSQDVAMVNQIYAWMKSVLGINDTSQGKADPTATSGTAKQLQIERALGRQESKIVMKNVFYSEIYRMIFEYMLAYADEPRTYQTVDEEGNAVESVFNRYEFLEQDEFGNWYYNDRFSFSVDPTGDGKENRQYVLELMEKDFQNGLYGDPTDPESLLNFWKDREAQNYPGAKVQVSRWTKKVAERKEIQEQMAALEAQIQQQKLQTGADIPMQNNVHNIEAMGGNQNAVPGM